MSKRAESPPKVIQRELASVSLQQLHQITHFVNYGHGSEFSHFENQVGGNCSIDSQLVLQPVQKTGGLEGIGDRLTA